MSSLISWGGNQYGQLGIGSLEKDKVVKPEVLKTLQNVPIAQVSCGGSHTLIALKDGSVYSCGNNDNGQLGHSKRISLPEKIDELRQKVVSLTAGMSHSLCLTEAREMFSWGDNSSGQLGRGEVDPDLCRIPKLIKFPHIVVQVSCGRNHCLSLTDDGRLFSWGENRFGQLGLGHLHSRNKPQFIVCLKGIPISQVACGGSHTFILSQSSAMFGWGRNCFGQLGVNDEIDRSHPTLCKSLRNQKVTHISCGEDHSAALTLDGGLFTFGAGTFGQLGHGSKTNEILPRKIMELMGSHVTQVSCGRRHSSAYVAGSGRLYTFGCSANGQLGVSDSGIKSTPVRIHEPFVATPTNGGTPMETDSGPVYVVNRIAAGGDHCFVWATSPERKVPPADYRTPNPRFKIKCLDSDRIEKVCLLDAGNQIPVELEDDITKIFSSAACLNSSFLSGDSEHFGTSSKKHGINLESAREQLQKLSQVSNFVIIQKILHSIENCLLPSLPQSPPDVEALRLYLLLPELHLFEEPKYYSSLIEPFGKLILQLDKPASRVLDSWWGSLSSSFVLKIITIYKETVIYILQMPDPIQIKQMESRYNALYTALEILKKMNMVNEQKGQIVPYNKFYISTLKDRVNVKGDYVRWIQQQSNSGKVPGKSLLFCNYPFTFDAAVKSLLLQTDAHMQMQSAIDEVHRRNIQSLFLPIDPVSPCLVFHVSRNNIVQDTIQQLVHQGSADLKKPLKVVFMGEEAQDEGGVRKEFFLLLLRELLDPKYGMFKSHEESRMEWFSPFTFEGTQMYLLIGCLCGLAIYNAIIIQLNFPLALFKKLLNRPLTLDDLSDLMPTVGKSFEELLAYEDDDLEDTFCLTFEVSQDYFGQVKNEELIPNGSSKSVTKENRKEFVDLYVDHIFNKSVQDQFGAFNTGFHKVCGGRVLELFHPQELRAMVVGNENYDFHELEKNTEYKGEYHRYHQTIKFFWDVFHDLLLEEKKNFLLFLTGSDKIPITGMKHVKVVIQPISAPEGYLPVAHTCFNLLDLPKYSSKAKLKEKLLHAITQTEGFGLV